MNHAIEMKRLYPQTDGFLCTYCKAPFTYITNYTKRCEGEKPRKRSKVDPKKDKNAIKFQNLNYLDVLSKDLKVMDASAISLARENKIPIVVCSINKKKILQKF